MVYKPCYNGNSSTAAPAFKDFYMVVKVFGWDKRLSRHNLRLRENYFVLLFDSLGEKLVANEKPV